MNADQWAELVVRLGFPVVVAGVLLLSILQAVRAAWTEVICPLLLGHLDQLEQIARQLTRLADALEKIAAEPARAPEKGDGQHGIDA